MKTKLLPLEKALNYQIFKLSLLLGRELMKALKEFELTPERWQILAALWESEETLNQTELANITMKDKPSISRLVESMVKSGWLIRKQNEEDSRAFLIRPSNKANANREKIISSLYSHFDAIYLRLGKRTHDELYELVKKYILAIERE